MNKEYASKKEERGTLVLNVTIEGIVNESFYHKRKDVIKVLPDGCKVPVHVSETVGTLTFDGGRYDRVIHQALIPGKFLSLNFFLPYPFFL